MWSRLRDVERSQGWVREGKDVFSLIKLKFITHGFFMLSDEDPWGIKSLKSVGSMTVMSQEPPNTKLCIFYHFGDGSTQIHANLLHSWRLEITVIITSFRLNPDFLTSLRGQRRSSLCFNLFNVWNKCQNLINTDLRSDEWAQTET